MSTTNGKVTYTTKAVNGDFTYTCYKTFIIPLNWINALFDIEGKFYDFAFTKSDILMELKLQPYEFSRLFFVKKYMSLCGITDIELYLYIKTCSTLPTDINQKGHFIKHYNAYYRDTFTMQGGITNDSSSYCTTGHKSTNDVYACLNLPDENEEDSTYLKQRYTLFNSV